MGLEPLAEITLMGFLHPPSEIALIGFEPLCFALLRFAFPSLCTIRWLHELIRWFHIVVNCVTIFGFCFTFCVRWFPILVAGSAYSLSVF